MISVLVRKFQNQSSPPRTHAVGCNLRKQTEPPFLPVSPGYFLMTFTSEELISLFFLPSYLHECYCQFFKCVFKTLNHKVEELSSEMFPPHEHLCIKHFFRVCTSRPLQGTEFHGRAGALRLPTEPEPGPGLINKSHYFFFQKRNGYLLYIII